jgi:hypothetical protein
VWSMSAPASAPWERAAAAAASSTPPAHARVPSEGWVWCVCSSWEAGVCFWAGAPSSLGRAESVLVAAAAAAYSARVRDLLPEESILWGHMGLVCLVLALADGRAAWIARFWQGLATCDRGAVRGAGRTCIVVIVDALRLRVEARWPASGSGVGPAPGRVCQYSAPAMQFDRVSTRRLHAYWQGLSLRFEEEPVRTKKFWSRNKRG